MVSLETQPSFSEQNMPPRQNENPHSKTSRIAMGTTLELLSGCENGFPSLCFIVSELSNNLHICNTKYWNTISTRIIGATFQFEFPPMGCLIAKRGTTESGNLGKWKPMIPTTNPIHHNIPSFDYLPAPSRSSKSIRESS